MNYNLQELYDKDFPLLDEDLIVISRFHDHFFTTDKWNNDKRPTEEVIKVWLWDNNWCEQNDRTVNMLKHYVKTHWRADVVGKRLHVTHYRDFITNIY